MITIVNVEINLGEVLFTLKNKIDKLLELDSDSKEWSARLERRIKISTHSAYLVQCLGMTKPIPLKNIYQPVEYYGGDRHVYDLGGVIRRAVLSQNNEEKNSEKYIFLVSQAGSGKSTALSYTYLSMSKYDELLPLLFVLRSPDDVFDLDKIVSFFLKNEVRDKLYHDAVYPVLLVDGYDEISKEDRQKVSEILRNYQAYGVGAFILSCRENYTIMYLKGVYFRIPPFEKENTKKFINAFSKAYKKDLNAEDIVNELNNRGFESFLFHPLMLTMICLIKTSANKTIPHRPLDLIRKAVDILFFRWDEERGVSRETVFADFSSEQRIKCLMHIAFEFQTREMHEHDVLRVINNYLNLLQYEDINPALVLTEISQWYGLFIQSAEGVWQFSHKVFHDFLSARYWVESGSFYPTKVNEWNTRAAYAACLKADSATQALIWSIRSSSGLGAFIEILANRPAFDISLVAKAVREYFRTSTRYVVVKNKNLAVVSPPNNFFTYCTDSFLVELINQSAVNFKMTEMVVFSSALAEARQRSINISYDEIIKETSNVWNDIFDSIYIDEIARLTPRSIILMEN